MFRNGILPLVAALAFSGAAAAPAAASGMKPAEKMCEALGGNLDAGMIDADRTGHGIFKATLPLRTGRGDEYRRQVSANLAQSHFATSAH